MHNLSYFFIAFLLFLNITYWISSIEKITGFKATLSWMNLHFAESILKNIVKPALIILVFFETVTALLSAYALFEILYFKTSKYFLYANISNFICLFLMLIAQRLAKDFDGARTIVIYIIPSLLALIFFNIQ